MHSPMSSVETRSGIVVESILKILHPVFTPNRCACVPLLGSFTMHRPAHTSPTLPFLNFPMICSLFFIFHWMWRILFESMKRFLKSRITTHSKRKLYFKNMSFREGGIHLPGTASLVAQLDSTFDIFSLYVSSSSHTHTPSFLNLSIRTNDDRHRTTTLQKRCWSKFWTVVIL